MGLLKLIFDLIFGFFGLVIGLIGGAIGLVFGLLGGIIGLVVTAAVLMALAAVPVLIILAIIF